MERDKKDIKNKGQIAQPVGADFFERLWEESWIYIKTVVDVLHEPVLILDKDLRVLAANEPFYKTFMVDAEDTEQRVVYDLGNGQWDIPSLRKLLEDILPGNTFFKGFQVAHEFPVIGRKVMILNARQIYVKNNDARGMPSSIILLAMEDVTEMMVVAETLASHAKQIESNLMDRIGKLEKEIHALKKNS